MAASLNMGEPTAGGVTVPQPLASSFIAMLRPRVVVSRAGARSTPIPAGQLRKARQTGGATAGYGAELAAIMPSQPALDPVDLNFRKLTSLVPVSNSLLAHSSIAMAQFVRDDMLKVMALREDLGFLRNDGTNGTPTGLRYWAPAWVSTAVAATANAVDLALRQAVARVEDADVGMIAPGWVMRASTKAFIASLRDANGNKLYPEVDAAGTLMGFPIYTSSQVPNNLGTGGDETEIYFADFAAVMIGDAMTLRLDQSTEASFTNEGGTTVSAFQTDQTLFRAITEHDLAPEHDVAITGFNVTGWALS